MARTPWLENYLPGNFRGVPFKVASHQFKSGRRTQKHEFPQRDRGRTEDLGRALGDGSLELYVIGDDYFAQRNALSAALETEGPGILVHPYLGRLNVQAGLYTLSETTVEGRMARFSVQFSEAGEVLFPDEAEDDISNAETNAGLVIDNSQTAFEEAFSVANQPAFVVQDAADKAGAVGDFLEDSVAKVTEPIANLTFAIRNYKAEIGDLIKAPGELSARIQGMFLTLLDELNGEPETSSRVLGNFKNFGNDFDPIIGNTPSRNTQQANEDALLNNVKEMSLANDAKATVETDFASIEDALAGRDNIVEAFNGQLLLTTDDDLFQSIRDLQTSLTRAIPRPGTTELLTFTPPKTLPALVIVHNLLEDLSKEQELIDQNAIEHPGFVPGGEEIEVSAG